MSEFGNETVTATMKTGEKTISALLKLLKFLMERNDRKLNRMIKKQQIKQAKSIQIKNDRQEYLNQHRGMVKAMKLLNSGEPLIPLAVALSPKELSRFNRLAKIEGVSFSAISNEIIMNELKDIKKELKELDKSEKKEGLSVEQLSTKNELLNKKKILEEQRDEKIIIIREKDLGLVKDITDRMNIEIKLQDIDRELNYLLSKEENLTEQEKKKLEELKSQKESIISSEFEAFNEEKNNCVYENAVGNPVLESLSFERAVNRVTDREYAEQPCYICERTIPENYLEVTSQPMEHEGRTFINTEYKVFRGEEQKTCSEFSHGKFTHYTQNNGENSSVIGDQHWENMKKEIKEKGGFTDDTLIFSNKEDYLKYKESYEKAVIAQEVEVIKEQEPDMEKDSVQPPTKLPLATDYETSIDNLKEQAENKGFYIDENNSIMRMDTGVIVTDAAELKEEGKIYYAEVLNIKEQIDVYQRLQELEKQKSYVQQQQDAATAVYHNHERDSMTDNLHTDITEATHKKNYDCDQSMASLKGRLNVLKLNREKLAGVSASMEAKKAITEKTKGKAQKDTRRHSRRDWERKVSSKAQEKPKQKVAKEKDKKGKELE